MGGTSNTIVDWGAQCSSICALEADDPVEHYRSDSHYCWFRFVEFDPARAATAKQVCDYSPSHRTLSEQRF